MLLKVTLHVFVIALAAIIVSSKNNPPPPHLCTECEEEVWEEVPCDEITTTSTTSSTSTTTTTTPKPTPPPTLPPPPPPTTTTTTQKPYKKPSTTTLKPTTTTTVAPYKITPIPYTAATRAPFIATTPILNTTITTTPSGPYQECYCECKKGCRQFCRKVTVNANQKKEITHITKTTESGPDGHIETTHIHQHKFLPLGYGNGTNGIGIGIGSDSISRTNVIIPSSNIYTKTAIAAEDEEKENLYPVENSEETNSSYESSKPAAYTAAPLLPGINTNYIALPLPAAPIPPAPAQLAPSLPPALTADYSDRPKPNNYPQTLVDSSYSIDELTKLLQAEGLGRATYPSTPLYYRPIRAQENYPEYDSNSVTHHHNHNANNQDLIYSPIYNHMADTPSGSASSVLETIATPYSSSAHHADSDYHRSNSNHISRDLDFDRDNDSDEDNGKAYVPTTPEPSADQLSSSSLNDRQIYDFSLAGYLNNYAEAPSAIPTRGSHYPSYPHHHGYHQTSYPLQY